MQYSAICWLENQAEMIKKKTPGLPEPPRDSVRQWCELFGVPFITEKDDVKRARAIVECCSRKYGDLNNWLFIKVTCFVLCFLVV